MYSQQTATDVLDIPALIVAFAVARGWTNSGLDTKITRPGGGRQFEITADKSTTRTGHHRVTVTDVADPTRKTWTSLPQIDGTAANAPVILTPTKVHLFGNDAPYHEEGAVAPWIACVIECGFNHYRHVYIGNMVKVGSYDGGEIISANYFAQNWSGSPTGVVYTSSYNRYLFSARCNPFGSDGPNGRASGGVNVVHADNPQPYRYFSGPTGSSQLSSFQGYEAIGGAQDNVNSALVTTGKSDFAGAAILVPVNMYCPDGADGSDYRFRPLGFPAGVRMINLEDHQPGDSIVVGNRNWRVFAEFQRNPETTVWRNGNNGATGYYCNAETSYYLGLAYPETDS